MVGIDGSNLRTLYSRKNEMMFPTAWSPDGRTIAVGMAKDFYKSYDIGLVSAEDGSLRILKTEALPKVPPKSVTFSPDGRFLLVDPPQKDGDTKRDIFALSVDGTQEVRVVEHPADDTILGWVPGSDRLLFLSDRTGTRTPGSWTSRTAVLMESPSWSGATSARSVPSGSLERALSSTASRSTSRTSSRPPSIWTSGP